MDVRFVPKFKLVEFETDLENNIKEGTFICHNCKIWHPISNGIADFLPPVLANKNKRKLFANKMEFELENCIEKEQPVDFLDKKKTDRIF